MQALVESIKSFVRNRFNAPHLRTNTYRSRDALAICVVLLLVVVGVCVVWFVPALEVGNAKLDPAARLLAEDNARKTIAQIVLSIFGLLILYFTWRRAQIMTQSHITDRFAKAIEQLGKVEGQAPNLEARLGGIYALERIAMDSPRDHWSIMEILTAYVRVNAPIDPGISYTKGEKPRTDIQAILTVLGRRRIDQRREQVGPGRYLDLSRTRLCGARLTLANLEGVDLSGVDLQGAWLWGARLSWAALMEANLSGAKLTEANLRHTFFRQTNLSGARMDGADISEAVDLTAEQLQSALIPMAKSEAASSRAATGV
jgi:Pentapeptide repeats (8 copies)